MATRYPQTILLSCEIPWDEQGSLLEDCFRREIRALLAQGFNHLYIFGTAGEGYAVTGEQYRQIVRIFWEETHQDGVSPMVGVIAMSTPQILERVSYAFDLGVRAFQISLPPWGALDDSECLVFFSQVCGAFPEARFIHYNLPRARRVLLGPEYRRLVAEVPNLAGTKNCRTDISQVFSIATGAPELQHFYGEHGFPHGCLFGECSLLSSFGALFPAKTQEFFQYGVGKQWDKLFPLQAEYLRVMEDFLAPTQGREAIDGAYDKMIVRASGMDMPLRLLPPYQGFDEQTFAKCLRQLKRRHPKWLE
jgi:dihydrodipicolinate synthase/N-acetylneuraminate lyase